MIDSLSWLPEGACFGLIVRYARSRPHPGKMRMLNWLLKLPLQKRLRHAGTGARLDVTGTDYVCVALITEGNFEPVSLALGIALMKAAPGTFLDVGAHMGLYTTVIGVGTGSKVVSIEPSPKTFARLSRNARLNPALNAELVNAGAASRSCFLQLSDEPDDLSAWTTIAEQSTESKPGAVPGRRIEDILVAHEIGRIGLLKIDVEGYEIEALSGLDWNGSHRPVHVLMECNPQQPEKIQFMIERGYTARTVDDRPITGEFSSYPEGNLLFTDQAGSPRLP